MKSKIQEYSPLFKSILLLLLAFLMVKTLSNSEVFVNEYYPQFYRSLYPNYSLVFGLILFSLGDIFYAFLFVYLIFMFYKLIRCMFFKQEWRGVRVLSRLIYFATIIYLSFNILWGFNYDRTNLIDNYNIKPYKLEELKSIATTLLNDSKNLRNQVEENNKREFVFNKKDFKIYHLKELDDSYDLPFHKIPQKSFKKYSLYSWLMRYAGVSGYYNPFTMEAQVVKQTADVSLPFTMAHEQAHQMGYAPEFEANYVGYLTCVNSSNPALKYSANYKALKYVLREIYSQDSVFVQSILDDYSNGMKRDYEVEKEFYQRYSGKTNEMFSSMNHIYLKSNHQDKGINSYNQFVDLLVYYFRNQSMNEFKK